MAGPQSINTPDPSKIAISSAESTVNLGLVTITTTQGSAYTFADMDLDELRRVLPESGRVPQDQPTLTLMNVSIAVLSLPFRIVKSVRVGTTSDKMEVLWSRA